MFVKLLASDVFLKVLSHERAIILNCIIYAQKTTTLQKTELYILPNMSNLYKQI